MLDDSGAPLKLVAFGGNAHGIIAVGGAARGVVAIGGGVAIGVVAIGVNAVGSVLAIGVNAVAPISIALANGGGVLAFVAVNGVGGFGWAGVNAGFSPFVAIVFGALLAAVAAVIPRPPPLSAGRDVVPFDDVASGKIDEGWVSARLDGPCDAGIALLVEGRRVEFAVSPAALEVARLTPDGTRMNARLVAEIRVVPVEDDYRAPPREERVLRCDGLEAAALREVRLSSVWRWSLVASALAALVAGAVGVATR